MCRYYCSTPMYCTVHLCAICSTVVGIKCLRGYKLMYCTGTVVLMMEKKLYESRVCCKQYTCTHSKRERRGHVLIITRIYINIKLWVHLMSNYSHDTKQSIINNNKYPSFYMYCTINYNIWRETLNIKLIQSSFNRVTSLQL